MIKWLKVFIHANYRDLVTCNKNNILSNVLYLTNFYEFGTVSLVLILLSRGRVLPHAQVGGGGGGIYMSPTYPEHNKRPFQQFRINDFCTGSIDNRGIDDQKTGFKALA